MCNKLNSKQIGNLTEMQCMISFLELGHNVLTPYGDCERYDFVADINGELIKIQCKTSHSQDNGDSFSFSTRSTHYADGHCIHEKYTKDEIDYFATIWNDKCYLVPVEECGNEKRLRINTPKNYQKHRVNFAEEYLLENILSKI